MKFAGAALKTHLQGATTTLATLWKITRADGAVFGYTDHDVDIVYSGITYRSAVAYSRSSIDDATGMQVANLEVEAVLDDVNIADVDLLSGLWDNAKVQVSTINWADPSMGIVELRTGTIGEVRTKNGRFTSELRGLTQNLQQTIGELYSATCRADLGDARCKINLASYTVAGAVTATADQMHFTDSVRGEAANYFVGGKLTWTSGLNVGLAVEVKSFAAGVFGLFLPAPYLIQVGDAYTVYPGCYKTFATCKNVFANVINRRAEDYIPGIDRLLS